MRIIIMPSYNQITTFSVRRLDPSSGDGRGRGVVVDPSGNVYLSGLTDAPGGQGNDDLWLSKHGNDGSVTWQRSVGGSNLDVAEDAVIDSNGDIISVGMVQSSDDGNNIAVIDGYVVKHDSSGNVVWQNSFGNATVFTDMSAVAVDSSDDIYIAGYYTGVDRRLVVAKISSDGNTLLWYDARDIVAGNESTLLIEDIVVQGTTVTVVGSHGNSATNQRDATMWQWNTSGGFLLEGRVGGNRNNAFNSVVVDSSGNIYAAGFNEDNSPAPIGGFHDAFVGKFTNATTKVWTENIGLLGGHQFTILGLALNATETSLYFTGTMTSVGTGFGGTDWIIGELTNLGAAAPTLVWCNHFGSVENELANRITVDSNGYLWVGGHGEQPTLVANFMLGKFPSDGSIPNPGPYSGYQYAVTGATQATRPEPINPPAASTADPLVFSISARTLNPDTRALPETTIV